MASVVLGCRGCHQTRECGSGCQGAPTAGKRGVRLSGDVAAAPGSAHHHSGGAAASACRDHREVCWIKTLRWPAVPRPATDKPRARTVVMPLCLGPLSPAPGIPEGCGEPPGMFDTGAPSRRSLHQHPHGCQSSGDNELLMCLKSDAGCMARS